MNDASILRMFRMLLDWTGRPFTKHPVRTFTMRVTVRTADKPGVEAALCAAHARFKAEAAKIAGGSR